MSRFDYIYGTALNLQYGYLQVEGHTKEFINSSSAMMDDLLLDLLVFGYDPSMAAFITVCVINRNN